MLIASGLSDLSWKTGKLENWKTGKLENWKTGKPENRKARRNRERETGNDCPAARPV
jgi:hypothetical protein